ncbi:MAG: protein kinase [Myxococcota bacterium]
MTPDRRQYRLRQRLGRGGFGEVYLAVMEAGAVRAEVAVKLLKDGLDAGDQALERLRDEGRLLGLLNHPVILKVHDLLVLDGRVALVTEYVDGADLAQCLAADGIPLRALVEVVGRVADALGVAWSAASPTGSALHLIHRDVKPANIRIGRHGDVKLLDFGLARAADVQREARTETASIFGSIPYMAPERFDNKAPIGPAADVFALGAVLYEGLTGQRLLSGLSTKAAYLLAMSAVRHRSFVERQLDELPPSVPTEVRDLLVATLAFDPAARPTASDVAATCEQLAEGLPGAGLRRYCRDRTWTPPADDPGGPDALDGRVLTVAGLEVDPPDATLAVRPLRRWVWAVAAVGVGAAAVILAHNHPSGDPTPSEQDRDVTSRVARAGRLLGVPLLDHLVVGREGYVAIGVTDGVDPAPAWSATG